MPSIPWLLAHPLGHDRSEGGAPVLCPRLVLGPAITDDHRCRDDALDAAFGVAGCILDHDETQCYLMTASSEGGQEHQKPRWSPVSV